MMSTERSPRNEKVEEIGSSRKNTLNLVPSQPAVLYLDGTLMRPVDQGQCDQDFMLFVQKKMQVSLV